MDRGWPAGALPAVEEGDAAEPVAKRPQKRKNLFGRADLAEVYRRARDMLAERGVFRMVQVMTDGDGSSSLVICNLWRVDRSKDGAVKALEWDMATGQWAEVKELVYWPSVPLFPIQQAQSLGWWRDVARSAVWKVLKAAGYDVLPRYHTEVAEWGYDEKTGLKKAVSGRPEMTPGKLAYILVERYIGKAKRRIGGAGEDEWSKGVLKPEVMTAGARALRAAIFDHVIEADLMSAILAIDFKLVTLWDYLRYAARRDAILRVARERRNLLPLLPAISKDYWDRKDLFSRKLWVKDGRKRTLVDYARFSEEPKHGGFSSLDSRGALRWLSKSQLTVVRRWSSVGKDVTVLENLSRANISVKIPAIAWCHIVTDASRGRVAPLGVRESVQRLYRVFAVHCAEMWKEKGFASLKGWLKTNQASLGDVYDWLIAEGFAQGHPDKHATWNSILRRCDDWHERVAIENVERSVGDNRTWESLLGEVVIDEVTFTPLNSARDIAREGYRQQHCVGDFVGECEDGRYRVYTVLEPDETRSTLGLWLDGSGRWTVEQHRGKYNGVVSVVAVKAGLELVRRYQQLHLGRMKSALSDGSMQG